MKYKAVLFDLDGTLLDTLSDLEESVNYVMRKYGHPEHSRDEVRRMVGNGVRNLMRRAIPDGESDPRFEEELREQITYYRAHDRVHTRPYEGIEGMLDSLREHDISVAILSNKEEVAARGLCEFFFMGRYDLALGNTKERPRKPDPIIIKAALEKFGLDAREVIYVGDSETDAQTAENAGVDYILVAWGFRSRDILAEFHAKAIIDTPGELISYVYDLSDDA